jgi:hypothetical protein
MRTPPNEPHHIVTSSETGRSEHRRLLTKKQFRFDLEMALRDSSAFSGTARGLRKERTTILIDSIIHHMRLCNLKVFGGFGDPGNVHRPGANHLWKTDEEYNRGKRFYEAAARKDGED